MIHIIKSLYSKISPLLNANVYWCRNTSTLPDNSMVFFPVESSSKLCCGLCGLVSYKKEDAFTATGADIQNIEKKIDALISSNLENMLSGKASIAEKYFGGKAHIEDLKSNITDLKKDSFFADIYKNHDAGSALQAVSERLERIIHDEEASLNREMGHLTPEEIHAASERIESVKDINWCISNEILSNVSKVRKLITRVDEHFSDSSILVFKKINTVLNSIDFLEVRGRDSAGISVMFIFKKTVFEQFRETLVQSNLASQLKERANLNVLKNNGISIHDTISGTGEKRVAFATTYKVAAEIGSLGDNVRFLRNQIRNDQLLQIVASFPFENHSVIAHTRWASVGEISEANCHPVDNETLEPHTRKVGLIHVALNGDIDNYKSLKSEYEDRWSLIQEDITTDTKIIALQIESYLKSGYDIDAAFQKAVNDFDGSHAISMHTDLAPGKIFLAQRGSGQAVFIGIAPDHYIATSEVYGFVEETQQFIKMDGESIVEGKSGKTQGQIVTLDQNIGGSEGISAVYYDGTPVDIVKETLNHTEITSRDIDRQNFEHYFLKEISESPNSVERTLQGRWEISDKKANRYNVVLDESVVPAHIQKALKGGEIRRIFFMGQGTAGVAALTCADILNYYINDPHIQISALKASELSGFMLTEKDTADSMADTLVIAISQSGTTTDTNRSVDMVKERGAKTLAIVNRRDSDLTFKTDGVIYTSSGRDIEMSVASTKAFYSQIVAGALLGLHIARLKGSRDENFVSDEIRELLRLPDHMRSVLETKENIGASAKRLAVTKTYWAAVGSGPNKAAADEIRIKLSELCYKTISSDYVEDKKHIDLSSEPLIIICAAGTRGSVIGDIIKDTAIFHAHKATPVVIADEGETRFTSYAADVFYVPKIMEHLAPVLNTLAGHIWGYYAALSINDASKFIYSHREEIQNTIDDFDRQKLDIYEIILEKFFREKIAEFYKELRRYRAENRLPVQMGSGSDADLILLLKYLSGRLPVSDFELDFDKKGTPGNMLESLFEHMGDAVNSMARPIDAIKHQAKTVTVGTSRITSEKLEGILFDELERHNINSSQITNKNIIVIKNLQGVVSDIKGAVLYRISGLNVLGEANENTTIHVEKKFGVFKKIPSRVETDNQLKGTKSIIVREGNVFIGQGLKDGKSILVIPVISADTSKNSRIEYLLSLNVAFKEKVPLFIKARALGGKLERIRNIIQEKSISWDDTYLDMVPVRELFGLSAEKTVELIAAKVSDKNQ